MEYALIILLWAVIILAARLHAASKDNKRLLNSYMDMKMELRETKLLLLLARSKITSLSFELCKDEDKADNKD